MCPPPVATTSDSRLRNCPIARSITYSLDKIDHWIYSLGYSAANFLVTQILAYKDARMQLFVMNNELCTILLQSEVITRQLVNVW